MPRARPRTFLPERLALCAALTAFALLGTMAATAAAATPFTAGTGAEPSVAVGSDGTGHVVWNAAGADAKVGYCRIAPGASTCERTALLDFGTAGDASFAGRPQVFVSPTNADEIVVTANCHQCPSGDTMSKTYSWTSSDRGETFGAAHSIGSGTEVNGRGTLLFDFGGVFVSTNAARVKAADPGGTGVLYASGGIFFFSPEVERVPLPGTVRLVAAVNDLHTVKYGVYRSAGPHLPYSINDSLNWETNKTLTAAEPDNSETALNSGPNGAFLTYRSLFAGEPHVGLRRFDPVAGAFGLPSYVEGGDPIDDSIQEPDSFQDLAGRIHVVWESLAGGGDRLRYVVSDTHASSFGAPANLASGERFADPEVAAGPAGRGFAVWTGPAGEIRVVPLDPQPEPPAPPSGSGGSGGSAGPSGPGRAGDTRAPRLAKATIGSRTLRPGEGTDFRFTSSEAGQAVLRIEKRFRGLELGRRAKRGKPRKRCLPRTKKRLRALRRRAGSPRAYRRLLRRLSCRGWRQLGQIRQRVRPGVNTIAFGGRVAGRRLAPGDYRARLVVTDSAGNPSRTETLRFRVVARRHRPRR